MFQGTVAWAFFHVSRGAVSVLGAGQREDTRPEEGTPVPRGRDPARTRDTRSEEGTPSLRRGHRSLLPYLRGDPQGPSGSHRLAPAPDSGALAKKPISIMVGRLFCSE